MHTYTYYTFHLILQTIKYDCSHPICGVQWAFHRRITLWPMEFPSFGTPPPHTRVRFIVPCGRRPSHPLAAVTPPHFPTIPISQPQHTHIHHMHTYTTHTYTHNTHSQHIQTYTTHIYTRHARIRDTHTHVYNARTHTQ